MEEQEIPKCDCSVQKVVKRRLNNGVVRFEKQCQTCGKSKPVAVRSLSWSDKQQATDYEAEIVEAWDKKIRDFYDARRAQYEQIREQKSQEWWDRYNAYLKSEKWATKRKFVLKRDNYVCQACLTKEARQAHHLTYKHVGNEPLFELVAVCFDCHEKITRMDRENA